jgi:hypothetical protein
MGQITSPAWTPLLHFRRIVVNRRPLASGLLQAQLEAKVVTARSTAMLKSVFWTSLIIGAAVYLAMAAWSLPAITAASGGALPFDLRPLGYDFSEAQSFLSGLSDEGRSVYLNVQHMLDLFYPALLSVSLGTAMVMVLPKQMGLWRWALALFSVPGSLCDYRENMLVRRMLAEPLDELDPALVAEASTATVLKSAFTALAMGILLVAAVLWLRRRRWDKLLTTK